MIEAEAAEGAARVERLLVEGAGLAEQRIGERGQITEIGDAAVIGLEFVPMKLLGENVEALVGVVAPMVGAHAQAVEEAVFGIEDGEIGSISLGPAPRSTMLR